jgi:hypothetical protein
MGTIQRIQSASQMPVERYAVNRPLDSKIALISGEIDFYHQLLRWLLMNCRDDQQKAIEALQQELEALKDTEIPALTATLHRIKNGENDPSKPDLIVSPTHLQSWAYDIEGAFHALRSKIQEGFGKFIRVRIW